jgi:hypothetical protein
MKKFILVYLVLMAMATSSWSQKIYSRADIFSIKEITWMGLDFSMIKLIGPEGFTNPIDIVNNQFWAMNNLILNEPDKYDIKKYFFKQSVAIDLSTIRERNTIPDPNEIVLPSGSSYSINVSHVQDAISQYNPEEFEGIGLVFIMETFNKDLETGTMWVTFFDIGSREVLLTDRMSGKAGGFGFRNYWAKTFYNVMKEVEKSRYNSWK